MKAVKIVVLLLIVLLALVVTVGGILLATLDPNDYKAQIAAKVKASTGRDLSLEGPIEWGFWPKLRLKAGPLALGNAPGFGDEPFLAAQEVQVAVATWPLLSRRVEMDTVKLYGLRLNLAKNDQGVANWDDLTTDEGKESTDGGSPLAALILGGVDIQDAAIAWQDATTGQDARIDKLNVSTGPLTFGEPVVFKLTAAMKATKPAVDGDTALSGTVAYDLDAERYTIAPLALEAVLRGKSLPDGKAKLTANAAIELDLAAETAQVKGLAFDGLGIAVTGDVNATHIKSERPGTKGAVQMTGKDLALVFRAFELPAAAQIAKVKDRSFSFKTSFDANMDTGVVTVPEFDGRMLGATITGVLNAERANTDTPSAKGNVKASGPDLPALLIVLSQINGADAEATQALNKALAKTQDRSFAIDVALDADLAENRVDLPQLSARLLGNDITGRVTSAGGKGAVKGRIDAKGPDLPGLLAVGAALQRSDSGLHGLAQALANSPDKAFDLSAVFDADPKQGRIEMPELAAHGLGLTLTGKFKAADIHNDKGAIDGHLALTGEKLSPLLTALDQADLAKSVQALAVEAGIKGSMADLVLSPLRATARVAGVAAAKPVTLELAAGTAQANLEKETLTVKDLTLTGLGMNVKGNLDATGIKSAPLFTGQIDVPAFNLRNLLANLNKPLPPMADAKSLTSVGLNAAFKGSAQSLVLNGLAMKLDDTTIKGDVNIADFAGPDVGFKLAVDALNADRYLAPKAQGAARPVTPEAAAAGATQLPVETLRSLKVKGDLTVGSLQLSGAKLANVVVGITGSDGKIAVNPLTADLYQGKYTGAISIDATAKQPQLAINTNLAKVAVEPLLVDLTGKSDLSGSVNFEARLTAIGGDSERLKNTLNGQATFAVQNGVFRGVDVPAVLKAAEMIVESKSLAPVPKGGETHFQSLTGSLDIKNGAVFNKDLLLDGAGFRVSGEGMLANLNDMTIKYDSKISVDEASAEKGADRYNLGGYTIPIRCRGAISGKSCLPDFGELAKSAATAAVKKKIEEKVKDAVGGEAGKALKDLLKF